MKALIFILLTLATFTGYSQRLVPLDAQPPQLAGGFDEYIEKNIKLPGVVRRRKIEGEVQIKFMVDSMGSIPPESITLVKGLCTPCDEEAIRLVRESPAWTPANNYDSGKNVSMAYQTTVRFYSHKRKKRP